MPGLANVHHRRPHTLRIWGDPARYTCRNKKTAYGAVADDGFSKGKIGNLEKVARSLISVVISYFIVDGAFINVI